MFAPVYLDYNATTPLRAAVREAMLPWLGERFGNASSRHEYGRAARKAIDEARERVAVSVNAHPTEVVFVSCGSEANNLFVKGVAAGMKPGLVAISAIEHPCVREPARQLHRSGWTLREVGVDTSGRVQVEQFQTALDDGAALCSVMLANNETGVLQDVPVLAGMARSAGRVLHTDAVQALGKVALDYRALGVHAMSLSSHKVGGPQGAAALILDKRLDIEALVAGGGHERGVRSGTENVAAVVGFGVACEHAAAQVQSRGEQAYALRQRLEDGLARLGALIFGLAAPRLPNTTYFALPGFDGETLVGHLDRDGWAVASGAACSSAQPEPSRTLLAMGVEPGIARGAVRVSTGWDSTTEHIDRFLSALGALRARLGGLAAVAAA